MAYVPKAERHDPKPYVVEHIFPGGREVVFRFAEYERARRKANAIAKSNCIEFPFRWVHKEGAIILRSV
jgi:hypothetical protein